MAQARRSTDRRRRVLYQAHSATAAPSTPASRRAAEKLRAARQPAKAFGSRVGQPLRGRWFSLVPSSTLAVTAVTAVLCVVPITLALLHHLSFSWPALAYETDVARPLQIHRTDSFASWWTSIVLMLSAGVSILIFQLRRHRSDDFRGHYRLWRMVLIILLAASLHYTVDLVGWVGAVLDLGFGDRAVLSGAKWLRIVMDVGGIILAMQLLAEVFRCRAALVAMIAACVFFAVLELSFWNVIEVRTNAMATLVTAAPVLGFSCFLMASTIYLRALYRQVVNVSNEVSLRDRFSKWLATWRDQDIDVRLPEIEPAAARNGAVARVAKTETADQPATTKPAAATQQPTKVQKPNPAATSKSSSPLAARRTAEPKDREEAIDQDESVDAPKRGLWSRLTGRSAKKIDDGKNDDQDLAATEVSESDRTDESTEEKPKRRWFGLRAGKAQNDEDETVEEAEEEASENVDNENVDNENPKKKPWFSLRLQPKNTAPTNEVKEEASQSDSEDDSQADEDGEKKPGLFGRLFSRKKSDTEDIDFKEDEESATAEDPKPSAARKPGPLSRKAVAGASQASTGQHQSNQSRSQSQPAGSQQRNSGNAEINPDDIDWESLSKSERRRLRKQIKRSGRAA